MAGLNRRRFITTVGAAAVACIGGAAAWRAVSQSALSTGMGTAYQPWLRWNAEEARRQFLVYAKYEPERSLVDELKTRAATPIDILRAGILAPSILNSQPWKFRVTGSTIDLFADSSRAISSLDPFKHEMSIALGCALENILLSASASGFSHRTNVLPDPARSDHMATVVLEPGGREISPLYRAIPNRRINRGIYGSEKVGADLKAELYAAAGSQDPNVRVSELAVSSKSFVDASLSAAELLLRTPAVLSTVYGWFRHERQRIHGLADGLTVDSYCLSRSESFARKIMPQMSQEQFAAFLLKHTHDALTASRGIWGVISVKGRMTPKACLSAGRTWQRIQLAATLRGLGFEPVNLLRYVAEVLPDRSDIPDTRLRLSDVTGDARWAPVIVWRAGFPDYPAPPTPRRSLGAMVV